MNTPRTPFDVIDQIRSKEQDTYDTDEPSFSWNG